MDKKTPPHSDSTYEDRTTHTAHPPRDPHEKQVLVENKAPLLANTSETWRLRHAFTAKVGKLYTAIPFARMLQRVAFAVLQATVKH